VSDFAEKFWARVYKRGPDECWPWMRAVSDNGYGQVIDTRSPAPEKVGPRKYGPQRGAHVVAHELAIGPVPMGHEVDHLCETRSCCNPAHLEATTRTTNATRAYGQRDECLYGHPLDGIRRSRKSDGRVVQQRYCKACQRAHRRAHLARKAAAA
jgi:hypothetical protein